MSHSPHFGAFLRAARNRAGLSLRALARHIGVSHVFLGEVERGRSAPLDRKHWPKLLEMLTDVDEEMLERELANTRPLQLNLADRRPEYQDLARALARRIEAEDLELKDIQDIKRVLEGTKR